MNFFKKISIRNKILVLILIIVVPIIIGQSIIMIYTENVSAKRELLSNYMHFTKITGEYTSVDIFFNDREEAIKSISKLIVIKNILDVVIFDNDGRVFVRKSVYSPSQINIIPINKHFFTDNTLLIHQEISYKNSKIGSIYVVVSTDELWDKLQQKSIFTTVVCIILLVIVTLAAFILQKFISNPILELTSFTKKVALAENYSLRGITSSSDEIADLTQGVNQMLQKIQSTTVSKDFVSKIIENMANSLVITDGLGKIKQVNNAFLKLINEKAYKLKGKNILDYLNSPTFSFTSTESFVDGHLKIENGKEIPVEYSSFSIDTKNIALIIHDLTTRKKYEQKISDSLKEKESLIKEIHHRVKNNLQIMSSLMNLQANSVAIPELHEVFNKSKNRIYSMALIHAKLYQTEDLINIDVEDYVETLAHEIIRTYNIDKQIDVVIKSDVKFFGIDVLVPIGLMFNELITNTIKYAFPDRKYGLIEISFKNLGEGYYEMIYSDNGIGLQKKFNWDSSKSLGMKLVKVFTEQLDGEITIDKKFEGTKFILKFKRDLQYPKT